MIQELDVRTSSLRRTQTRQRPAINGKFLVMGHKSLWVKGVTYGTFRRCEDGSEYNPRTVEYDFALMRRNHINAIRIYTIPPVWMLDLALTYGIRVFSGFAWEQHVSFLDQASSARSIRKRLKNHLSEIAGHPALLACAIGNEIPSPIVRWHGANKIETFLRGLYEEAKDCDPGLLVTYVNYPSTEYLNLPFLDFYSFNVFLESKPSFQRYLLRLHNLAENKPLFLTEIGLDSQRNGLERQARLVRSQIWSSFRTGCAGVFVYAWTDEWFRGGQEVEDWDFGLTTRDRHPKPALETVRNQFAKVPFRNAVPFPKISVVICSYNGSKTIEQCLKSCMELEYDDFEVIVIDDGSTDATSDIASRYPVRLIRTPNRGLSAARNLGMKEAKGEIVAYIDDDAYPDQHWLHYLAVAFQDTTFACIGGPNLPPPSVSTMAKAIAHSPGGPVHVLVSDDEAEHVPGCNMAFRKEVLEAIGGFDPQFRVAGDDVDVCWRLHHAGHSIGFHSGAVVWHHRRQSALAYFRQQRGYGRAEVMLARKWPEKYNGVGHLSWVGRIYGNGLSGATRIYSGVWGSAPFQSLYERSPNVVTSLSKMPEWLLLILLFGFLTGMGFEWPPLRYAGILFVASILVPATDALISSHRHISRYSSSFWLRIQLLTACAFLNFVQPFARLIGRFPLWRPTFQGFRVPTPRKFEVWNESWEDPNEKLFALLQKGQKLGAIVCHAGVFDRWDLETKGGAFGSARLLMTVEEHGHGKQMTRFSLSPHAHWIWPALAFFLLSLSVSAVLSSAWVAGLLLFCFSAFLLTQLFLECGHAIAAFMEMIRRYKAELPAATQSDGSNVQ